MVRLRLVVAAMVVVGLGGCVGSPGRECKGNGAASICLTKGSGPLFHLTATGLKPGSTVRSTMSAPGVAPGSPTDIDVGKDGRPQAVQGLIVPKGKGPATLVINAVAADGQPMSVTFHR